jgi:hypothetical protein
MIPFLRKGTYFKTGTYPIQTKNPASVCTHVRLNLLPLSAPIAINAAKVLAKNMYIQFSDLGTIVGLKGYSYETVVSFFISLDRYEDLN